MRGLLENTAFIFQEGPLGMTVGWIMWDDENASMPGTSNRNHHNGTLPAGKYDSNTWVP